MRFAEKIMRLVPVVTVAVGVAGCCGSHPRQPVKPGGHPFLQAYVVKGVVRELKAEDNAVVIQHEEISGYMPAMTMLFPVRNPEELAGLQPGDKVSFRMIVSGTNGWLEQITKINASPPSTPVPKPANVPSRP
jgi:protein SCO1/2